MSFRRTAGLAALALAIAGGPAAAQTADENRDADALAADMRILAANPLDIEALLTAAELTLRMGDNTAAAGFLTRAEKLDPLNPRIKAGWGVLMVRAERPGEALRRFQEAQARGLDPRKFAADRGLAYDLIGEQERAQRDYRLVLRDAPNDEVTRRYALSLGISGRRDEAMKLLDSLLRRSDRAAWRDRAFILAMTGDVDGAQKIANSMMSPGLGAGLAPFFRQLPNLSPADRAFAVTFGELRMTPERLADARVVPPLPPLGPDPYAPPRAVAVAEPVKPQPADEKPGKRKKKRGEDGLAPAVAPPPPPPPVEVAMTPPVYVAPPPPPPAPMIQPLPAPTPSPSKPPRVALSMPPVSKPAPAPAPTPAPKPAPLPPPVVVAPAPPVVVAAASPPPPPILAPPPAPAPSPAPVPEPEPGVADRPSPGEAGVTETATARAGEDRVLANIIAGISVPGSELGVAPMPAKVAPVLPPPPPPPPPVTKPDPVIAKPAPKPSTTRGRPTRDAVPDDGSQALTAKPPRGKSAAKPDLADGKDSGKNGKNAKGGKSAADDAAVAVDRNGCPLPPPKGKASAKSAPVATRSKSATTARGKASDARCKADTGKDKPDASTKGEPARIWVQVAGGANETTLLKAWDALKTKAPDLFRGRQPWTTPLRNTNRVLTGPFKTPAEAQAFVNQLSKAGITGFVFTSDKGQKIDRLGGK